MQSEVRCYLATNVCSSAAIGQVALMIVAFIFKKVLEVVNLRTREHLSIANTYGMPHVSKPQTDQASGLQMQLLHLLDRLGPALRWLRRLLEDTNHESAGGL